MAEQVAGEISLGETFHEVVFEAKDFCLKVDVGEKDGNESVRITSKVPIKVDFTKNKGTETAIISAQRAFEIGDKATKGKNKGWIYAGLSKDVESPGYNEPLWVAPKDLGIMTCCEALDTVFDLRKKNGKDRLATAGELTQIFGVVAKYKIDGFGREDYWAAEYNGLFSRVVPYQQFSHDKSDVNGKGLLKTMLLVR